MSLSKVIYALLFISYICLIGPGLLIGNSIEPMILGVPFFYFWTALWTVVGSILIVILSLKVWNENE
ncbi:hypothetical protein JCM17380_22430 [Desulfosporosinus burensis]